jgi:alkanesulfonate monooxygenase SsuD/methylene tetrahydromethanopterin reductase-like flavin-dependent oxidoreductase (luciferase family)
MAATADDVAGGRLILGLGCGWHEPEYLAFGYPFDHRVGRFEEALEIVARLLHGERVTFKGAWNDLDDAVVLPPPAHRIPILVASTRPRMMAATVRFRGRLADGVVRPTRRRLAQGARRHPGRMRGAGIATRPRSRCSSA